MTKDAVIDIIHKTIYGFFDVVEDDSEESINEKNKLLLEVNKAVCSAIKEMPDDERKTGRYEFQKNGVGRIQVVCPFCGKVFFGGGSVLHADGREENCTMEETVRSWIDWKELHKKYCDECGAKMEGVEE